MSTQKVNATAAQGATQRKGMGISKDTRGANTLKFKPLPEVYGGLCLGYLKEITIGEADFKEDQKGDFAEFAGKSVPTINFVFAGVQTSSAEGEAIYIHSFKPMPIIPGNGKYDWFYDSMFQTIKHFIDVYSNKNFLPAYEDLLFLEIDTENGMPFEAMVEAYNKFFSGIITVFNGNGTDLPCLFRTASNEGVLVWLKLLLYNNKGEVNNGNPGFGNYPSDGFIELYRKDVMPSLSIAIQKGESIIPREKQDKKANAPAATTTGAPTAPGAPTPPAAGASIPSFMTGGAKQG